MKKKFLVVLAMAVVALCGIVVKPVGAVTANECRVIGDSYKVYQGTCYDPSKSIDSDSSKSGQEKASFANSCSSKQTITVGSKIYCVVKGSGTSTSGSSSSSTSTSSGSTSSGSTATSTSSAADSCSRSGGTYDSATGSCNHGTATSTSTSSNSSSSSSSSSSSDSSAAATTGGDGITQTGDRGTAGEGASSSGNSCGGVNTSIIDCDDSESGGGGIFAILLIILNVLTFGIGIAGTLGIVIVGIMYLTARDNEAQMTKAKNMLVNIIIGLAAYAVMWAFLQWLLPGGIIG